MDDDNQIKSTTPEKQDTADTQPIENGQTSHNQNTENHSIIDVIGNGQLIKKVTKLFFVSRMSHIITKYLRHVNDL